MAITFEAARFLVAAAKAPEWEAEGFGTFFVAPYGAEDDTHYRVIYGAREALVDGNFLFERMDAPVTLVDKATGAILELDYLESFDRVNGMTQLGEWPE